jgi:hypothetical protein
MTLPPTASLAGAGLAVGEDADVESVEDRLHLRETGPLSQGVQAGRKALRIRHTHGVEVREKRPRGSKGAP